MAPRARPQRQPNPPAPPPRDSNSPELGDPSKMQQYNALTGRPIRHSAGKVKRGAGYVDSTAIDFSDGGEEELSEEEVKQVNDSIVVSKRKRKRSPSPPSPSLEPIMRDEPPDELTDDELEAKLERCPPKPPITLQFNVPLGFHGPLTVKLNCSLLESNEERAAHNLQPKPRQDKSTSSPSPEGSAALDRKVGFTDFPPELRNKVYRYLFLSDEPFKFPAAKNLCRSAQLLSSCKLVHSEGCSILYGENAFSFDRNRNSRGPFWEPVPQEIGYKDTLRFLQVIGPENLAYLREVKIVFEDANPASTPYLHTQEDRRYINDPYLLNCLRILREAKLRKLTLSFFGRRALMPCDGKFITYLERLKADEVEKPESPRWYSTHKIMYGMWERLHERITRKKKLYPENGK